MTRDTQQTQTTSETSSKEHERAQTQGKRRRRDDGCSHPARQAGLAHTDAANEQTYDFERLERAVAFLLEEHERLSGERAELLEELVDREQRIGQLESRLEAERKRRLTAVEGVDKVLARLEQLQTSVVAAAESA